ncbi:alpha-ketoglutarate-dependent dioxygenase AlkB family protein [Psychromonas antarctica]|uniref:alpha-ketoglutarate-dependent dioxygenase AlkB family protein n=1 Tax=Psychromonas antarctica TaxID=67573 RepID=UPI001EE78556|nr:alpha-ketoglutarate-dependent dioxygenase AlkB [Psychromonas antarctica]MCG6201055.1 alpha-ketoglutarate-dependent dioxygenase AlkB [Psychromonas antarctica]
MKNRDLFAEPEETPINVIDYDGTVEYHGVLIPFDQANRYFDTLLTKIQWQSDQANIFGKQIFTKRKVAWYGDKPFSYTYSNSSKVALPWINELLELKKRVEDKTGHYFNSCLLNLYHNGDEGMAWHSDGEKDLLKNGAIGSLSLGAERKFSFKHKRCQETLSVFLQHGSLLVMKGETQSHWLHRLPPTKKVDSPRINLTFRTIDADNGF